MFEGNFSVFILGQEINGRLTDCGGAAVQNHSSHEIQDPFSWAIVQTSKNSLQKLSFSIVKMPRPEGPRYWNNLKKNQFFVWLSYSSRDRWMRDQINRDLSCYRGPGGGRRPPSMNGSWVLKTQEEEQFKRWIIKDGRTFILHYITRTNWPIICC